MLGADAAAAHAVLTHLHHSNSTLPCSVWYYVGMGFIVRTAGRAERTQHTTNLCPLVALGMAGLAQWFRAGGLAAGAGSRLAALLLRPTLNRPGEGAT